MSGQWADSTRRDELPDDWPQRRAHVLERDSHRCQVLNQQGICGRHANEVDHIKPGNDHRYENLQAICSWHHRKKSAAEGNQSPNRIRISEKRRTEQHPGLL